MTHNEYLKQIGMEVKVARIRKNMQRKELCKLTGLCIESIKNIENGNADSKILSYKRIADALQVDIKNFL